MYLLEYNESEIIIFDNLLDTHMHLLLSSVLNAPNVTLFKGFD
jgi:hypothetical protein